MTRLSVAKDLDKLRQVANAQIDAAVRERRLLYITDAPGQDAIYQEKRAEADRWLAAIAAGQTPDLADYFWLPQEVGATAETPDELATLWVTYNDEWRRIGPLIEGKKAAAKRAVREANTPATIAAAALIIWTASP